MDNRITVYGSTGFIGSRFCQLNENNVIKNKRDDYVTKSDEITTFIKTWKLT
jgi:dTDP-D-glucose 4,6-dehydratase